jgi:peptidoglycan/LPS O-acetylase OafA/YrhL
MGVGRIWSLLLAAWAVALGAMALSLMTDGLQVDARGRTVAVPLILGAAQVGLWRIVRRRFPGQPTSHLLVLGTAFLSLGVLGIVAIATGLWRPV